MIPEKSGRVYKKRTIIHICFRVGGKVNLFSINGKSIRSVNSGAGTVALKLDIAPGTYVLEIVRKNVVITEKITITK